LGKLRYLGIHTEISKKYLWCFKSMLTLVTNCLDALIQNGSLNKKNPKNLLIFNPQKDGRGSMAHYSSGMKKNSAYF
jgi:hypothetical protein